MARVIVVGAGLGGMAAAARLAKLGHTVTVCERGDRTGGALGSVEADGFRWDTGAAHTTLPAALRDLFRKSGRPLEQEADLQPLTGPRRHVFADGTRIDLPVLDRAAQSAAWRDLAGERTAGQWTGLVDSFGDTWDVLRRTAIDVPLTGRPSIGTLRTLRPWQSLRGLAAKRLGDDRARAVLEYHARVQRSQPQDTPAFVGVGVYLERTFGCWTFPEGFAHLVGVLDRRLDQRGVTVRLGAEVVAVPTRDGMVTGVRLADGSMLDADIVVSDIAPRMLYEHLVSDPAADRVRRQVLRTSEAQAAYVVHLGLRDPLPDLPFETVLHGGPTVVIRTGGGAPAGHQAWSVLVHGYPPDDVVDLLTARGVDVADRVVTRRTAEPWRVEVAWEGARTALRRAGNISPVRGLYCVGSGAHPGGGVPATTLGAALVAAAVGKA